MLANFRRTPDPALSLLRYQQLAPRYDAACRFIQGMRSAAVEALRLREGEVVLDVGCGTGATLCALAEMVGPRGRAIGIEHSPGMVARARARLARNGLADRAVLIEAQVQCARIDARATALLFCYTHDVLQSPEALRNIFEHAVPGARVAVAGNRLQSWWWAAPINLWVCMRGWRYHTTFSGLRHPWRRLLDYCPDLRIIDTFHLGTSYLAIGTVAKSGVRLPRCPLWLPKADTRSQP